MRRMLPRVLDVVKKYKTNNPNDICKMIGVQVYRIDLHGIKKGVAVKALNKKLIYLDRSMPQNEQNVVLAHELAHVILHGFGNRGFGIHLAKDKATDRKELEAHKFAFLLIAHTCLRNEPIMIDSIRDEKLLTFDDIVKLLDIFAQNGCYI